MTQSAAILPTILVLAEAALLLHAAAHDIAARTIPDADCIALAVCGLLQRNLHRQLVGSLLAAGCVFAVCMLLWRRHLLGGGDVKLMAAAACLVAPPHVPALLCAIMIAGGLLACLYLVLMRWAPRWHGAPGRPSRRRLLPRVARLELWRLRRRAALPYGVAISTGALLQMLGA